MAQAAARKPSPQSQTPTERLAALYKALADPLRLQILRLLRNESFGVLELSRILDMRQSALSHHLKVLATGELVSTRREGNSIFYRRTFLSEDGAFNHIKQASFDQVDLLEIPGWQTRKIKQIQLERAQLSLSFFNRNADKFREKQGLIVAHEDYRKNLHDVKTDLGLTADAKVLEVGPGEGEFLVELAERFDAVTALDNSREMLEISRQACATAQKDNVDFILGDTAVARKQKHSADFIVFNMVLHHISSPAKTIKDCATLLNEGGILLIVDLCSHDQDWVRESCGDLWLGFDDNELEHWAIRAGLQAGPSSYLGLRNGFQILIRIFKKDA